MRWARSCICHCGRVFPAQAAAAGLSRFECQCAAAKWKVTLGRQRRIKHSGSLSEKHAGSFRQNVLASYSDCICIFFFYHAVVQALAKSH